VGGSGDGRRELCKFDLEMGLHPRVKAVALQQSDLWAHVRDELRSVDRV